MSNNIDALKAIKRNYVEFSKYTMAHRTYPSVFDGLKEVQRRCLYASYKDAPASMTKLSTIAGLIMAYHPHAEASDVVVKMAGEHQSSFPLYDTQGNFGDLESPASAPRYLECKLNNTAKNLYFKLIDEAPMENFEVQEEPVYLPTLFPVAFLQGCFGVGQGTPNVLIPELEFESLKNFVINYIKTGNKVVTADNFVRFTDYDQIQKTNRDESIMDVLNTGKGTVVYSPDIELKNNKITIRNIYVLAQFSSLLEKLKPDIVADKIDVRDESGEEKVWVIEKVKNKVFDMEACAKMLKSRFTFKERYAMYFYDELGKVRAYSLGEVIELCYEKYKEAYIDKLNKEIDVMCVQRMITDCLGLMSELAVDIVTDNKMSDEDKVKAIKLVIKDEYNEYVIKKCLDKPIKYLKKDEKAIKKIENNIKALQKTINSIDSTIVDELGCL